jgi:hypothetical protein
VHEVTRLASSYRYVLFRGPGASAVHVGMAAGRVDAVNWTRGTGSVNSLGRVLSALGTEENMENLLRLN